MLELIKKILRFGPFKVAYEPLHKIYRLYSVPHRRRVLRRMGPDVLQDLSAIFSRHNIQAFAAYGTLLGFVRENGFISHDEDMDFGVVPGTITPQGLLRILLEKEIGFDVKFIFKYQERVVEFKVVYKGIPIDFFFFEDRGEKYVSPLLFYIPEKKYADPRANAVREVTFTAVKGLSKTRLFDLVDFPIPQNAEDVLRSLYGESWRIPDKKWNDNKRPQIVEMPEPGYQISLDEAYALN